MFGAKHIHQARENIVKKLIDQAIDLVIKGVWCMQDQPQANPKKLFVGNLAFAVTTDDLRELFSQFGEIVDAIVLTDRMSGRSKGFGFVEFATEDAAQQAIEALHGQDFQGRNLVVNEARPQAPRPPRQYGQGGYRSDRRGGYHNDRNNDRSGGYQQY